MTAVLVTGGAGYIGSHAVRELVRTGHEVVVYDNLSAGHRPAADAALGGAGSVIEGDIRDTARLTEALRSRKIAAVMHFAASLSVGDSVKDPVGYYANNVTGALSVLQSMVAAGVSSFVFSSTAAVFGNPERTPITEDHPTAPINTYGETKLAVERALPHFERAYGLRSVALRYFNAAGADPDGLLGEDRALRHRPFEAGGKIVDHHHRPAAIEQSEHGVAADIAGAARHQHRYACLFGHSSSLSLSHAAKTG